VGYTTNRAFFPGSESLTFDPSHTHAYLANLGASTIDEYRVNGMELSPNSGSYVMDQGRTHPNHRSSSSWPSGKIAYATSESRTNHKLTELTVNPDGSLTTLGTLDTGNDVGISFLTHKGDSCMSRASSEYRQPISDQCQRHARNGHNSAADRRRGHSLKP